MKKLLKLGLTLSLSLCLFLSACSIDSITQMLGITSASVSTSQTASTPQSTTATPISGTAITFSTANSGGEIAIAEYNGLAYVPVNDNVPFFTTADKKPTSFERYDELDALNRCTLTFACIGKDLMPTEDRGEIGMIKPSGWQTVKYDCVSGKYLYNRCHLIGFQLTGENANKNNLITGTRYLNIDGMLVFEDMVADYIKETNNHVLYRVTPVFLGNNLVAHGVLMEGFSVEDNGDGITFNVYCYNVQPQIGIDYATGNSWLLTDKPATNTSQSTSASANSSVNTSQSVDTSVSNSASTLTSHSHSASIVTFVFNTNTKKFHLPTCSSATDMKAENRQDFYGTKQEAIDLGYTACGVCKP